MSASDVSPFHLLSACFTLLSDTCRWLLVWFVFVWCLCSCLVGVFCKWQSSQVSSVIQL